MKCFRKLRWCYILADYSYYDYVIMAFALKYFW